MTAFLQRVCQHLDCCAKGVCVYGWMAGSTYPGTQILMEFHQLQQDSTEHKLKVAEGSKSFILPPVFFPSYFFNCIFLQLNLIVL